MSWHFSRALVEEFLEANSSAGEQSAPSSSNNTHGMCWSPGKTMDASSRSRSGMMYEPLTESRGEELLTWFLEVFHARTSAPPERAPELAAREVDSGEIWRELSVKFDPVSSGWKTARCLWEEDLDWSCLTLPRWGSLHDGELWERATPGLRTSGNGSGFWPTPNVPNGGRRVPKDATIKGGKTPTAYTADGKKCQVGLEQAVQWWPTPCASEAGPDFAKLSRSKTGISLQTAVAMWPTPNQRDWKDSGVSQGSRKSPNLGTMAARYPTPTVNDSKNSTLPPSQVNRDSITGALMRDGEKAGGSLNPTWVEWLMGWPLGWTDCAVSATDKFRQWLGLHGKS